MAVNDIGITYNSNLANGSYQTITPPAGTAYMIHTICAGGSIEVYYGSSGFGYTLLNSKSGSPYTLENLKYFAIPARQIAIKNISGSAITLYVAYSQVN